MVINHLEKLFVTSDAATIIKEVSDGCVEAITPHAPIAWALQMEVIHPAAKMIVMASAMQEREVSGSSILTDTRFHRLSQIGDGSNFVVVFAGELMLQAAALIHAGLHPSDVRNFLFCLTNVH